MEGKFSENYVVNKIAVPLLNGLDPNDEEVMNRVQLIRSWVDKYGIKDVDIYLEEQEVIDRLELNGTVTLVEDFNDICGKEVFTTEYWDPEFEEYMQSSANYFYFGRDGEHYILAKKTK